MPKSPWRCSQCGTVNEPAANSCRTCGRWPSLFDLQDGVVGDAEPDDVDAHAHAVEAYEPEVYEADEPRAGELEADPTASGRQLVDMPARAGEKSSGERDGTTSSRRPGRGRRQLVRLIIPTGVLFYFLITSFSNH